MTAALTTDNLTLEILLSKVNELAELSLKMNRNTKENSMRKSWKTCG